MAITWNAVNNNFNAVPAVICLCFAVLAQIASNFANEYFDYKAGRDRPGREGPRRGVTEGEISPAAMKKAIYITLGLAGCLGLSLVGWGGWWLLAVGAFIAIGVFAYSAAPTRSPLTAGAKWAWCFSSALSLLISHITYRPCSGTPV